MTDKEFVKSVYPTAYFTLGTIITNSDNILWIDEYGEWAKEWNDIKAINYAWNELATQIKIAFLKTLES